MLPNWKRHVKQKNLPPIVRVTWLDACYWNGPLNLERGWEQRYKSGIIQQSTGYKLKQDAGFVTIGMDIATALGRVRHVMDLPMSGVLEIREMK